MSKETNKKEVSVCCGATKLQTIKEIEEKVEGMFKKESLSSGILTPTKREEYIIYNLILDEILDDIKTLLKEL